MDTAAHDRRGAALVAAPFRPDATVDFGVVAGFGIDRLTGRDHGDHRVASFGR